MHRLRITGNVRTTRERKDRGWARFSCSRGFRGIIYIFALFFYRQGLKSITHNADSIEISCSLVVRNHHIKWNMKSEFCFIRNLSGLSVGDFIYHVTVGSDARSQGRLVDVLRISADRSYYFERWCPEVDSLIDAAADRYRPCGCKSSRPFRSARITIFDLWRMIIDNGFFLFESNYHETSFQLWLNFHDDPDYIQKTNKQKVILRAQPRRSKNLSVCSQADKERLHLYQLAILAIFLIDGVVCAIFNI